ncbi:hypothetical protein HDE80_001976 [Rhodanobacter sp. A1T4]|jgi:hypothetical protein|nr:hypothetical protein [Rhodanobacter sp. A1T4]
MPQTVRAWRQHVSSPLRPMSPNQSANAQGFMPRLRIESFFSVGRELVQRQQVVLDSGDHRQRLL